MVRTHRYIFASQGTSAFCAVVTSALHTASLHAHQPHTISYSVKSTYQERPRSLAGSVVVARTALRRAQTARGQSAHAYGPWTHHCSSAPEHAARSNDCGAGIQRCHRPRSPEERGALAKGVRLPQPGHTCGTEIDHEHCQQGNGARWEGSGVAASSAPTLLVPKTTTDAAEVRKSDLLMVTRPPPS